MWHTKGPILCFQSFTTIPDIVDKEVVQQLRCGFIQIGLMIVRLPDPLIRWLIR